MTARPRGTCPRGEPPSVEKCMLMPLNYSSSHRKLDSVVELLVYLASEGSMACFQKLPKQQINACGALLVCCIASSQ
jgi:hypothetical protein